MEVEAAAVRSEGEEEGGRGRRGRRRRSEGAGEAWRLWPQGEEGAHFKREL